MLIIIIIVIIYCQAQGDEVTATQQPLSLSITGGKSERWYLNYCNEKRLSGATFSFNVYLHCIKVGEMLS